MRQFAPMRDAAENLDERFEDGVGSDFDVVINHAACGIEDGDSGVHEGVGFAHAHLIVDEGKLDAGVGAQYLDRVCSFPHDYALAGLAKNFGHVGEVILAVGIGSGEFLDVLEQFGHSEDVEASINLVNIFLCGAGGFFFHDGLDLGAARTLAQNAAVAGGILQVGAEQSHRGTLVQV